MLLTIGTCAAKVKSCIIVPPDDSLATYVGGKDHDKYFSFSSEVFYFSFHAHFTSRLQSCGPAQELHLITDKLMT
uniref:Uncharacterized protein n=1 Tax=Arundo donax TaxID=35708 RepID=A0A0A9BG59_ARUDO